MILSIPEEILTRIHRHCEQSYPDEGAGLLLGKTIDSEQQVSEILSLTNVREEGARYNRYQLSPQDYLMGEELADRMGLDVLGVYHSHPDHPNRPSEFDRQWAWPNFSYLITSVVQGKAVESRSWRLDEDRENFSEEKVEVIEQINT